MAPSARGDQPHWAGSKVKGPAAATWVEKITILCVSQTPPHTAIYTCELSTLRELKKKKKDIGGVICEVKFILEP